MAESKKSGQRQSVVGIDPAGIMLALVFVVLLSGALSVPFVYETQTLWYKFGVSKVMLRAGQMAGLFALVFLFLQIILAVRPKVLVDLYGGPRIVRWHQRNGILIVAAAFVHVLLVLVPEGLGNLPIGKKYWPEMVGGLLLLLLVITVAVSYFRNSLRLQYRLWKTVHRGLGYLIPILACVHVYFVSESFDQAVPRAVLGIAAAALVASIVGVKFYGKRTKKQKHLSR